ncbi:hypothetical protein B0J13DRAFT_526296 [Dactylonectria estremocensis]|uniref:Uncharacterized protein n=1 Tax=Dactylonectria estremocensis TaxID=1079267 RepID=A0A9P9ERF6_9HYPO|nr:hypothetical protein B0J13DRAFT_526296 [Dactylonectria estremocensis]
MPPTPPPARILTDARDSVARNFLILFSLNVFSLLLSVVVYFSHNREEADDLAQCIVGSIAGVAFVACSILIRSMKPNVYSRHELVIASLSDAICTMTRLDGHKTRDILGFDGGKQFSFRLQLDALERLRPSSSSDDVQATEQGQRIDQEASIQADERITQEPDEQPITVVEDPRAVVEDKTIPIVVTEDLTAPPQTSHEAEKAREHS